MGSKYSSDVKSNCVYYGYLDYVKRVKKEAYKTNDSSNVLIAMTYLMREEMTDCALRILQSQYRKYKRIRSKIDRIVKTGHAVFITLTFTDDVLAQTSALTRRRYVSRYLKQNADFYVANVDFSPNNNREHYHAVVNDRCNLSTWSCGFAFAEKVRTHENDTKRVSKYVAKLTAHSLKVKGSNSRLIYSKTVL